MTDNQQIICVTTDSVPGRSIKRVLGLVWSIGVTDGYIADPELRIKRADAARHKAYENMVERAVSMGANAVIGISWDSFVTATDYGEDREYTIYGTAVVLERTRPCPPTGSS